MSRIAFIVAATLISGCGMACMCAPPSNSLEYLNAQMTSATQVVRVKVVSPSTDEQEHWPFRESNRAYRVDLLESIKPARDARAAIEVRSATSSCQLSLASGDEWLLFIRDGQVNQCEGNVLLRGAAPAREIASSDLEYAAERLAAVRTLAPQLQSTQTLSDGFTETGWRTFRRMAQLAAWGSGAGFSMLVISWVVQWLTFIPIVAGEASIVSRTLKLPQRNTVKPIAIANLCSTLVGVPMAWFALLLVGGFSGVILSMVPVHVADSELIRFVSFPLFAAWVRGDSRLEGVAAFLVLMSISCWVAIFVERRVLRRYLSAIEQLTLGSCVRKANIASFIALSAVTLLIMFGPL